MGNLINRANVLVMLDVDHFRDLLSAAIALLILASLLLAIISADNSSLRVRLVSLFGWLASSHLLISLLLCLFVFISFLISCTILSFCLLCSGRFVFKCWLLGFWVSTCFFLLLLTLTALQEHHRAQVGLMAREWEVWKVR